MTNTQQSVTQEVRWQSTDESSKLRWTVGAFWQVAKEGSIEELKDPLNRSTTVQLPVRRQSATASSVAYLLLSRRASAYPYIPACDIYYNRNTTLRPPDGRLRRMSYRVYRSVALTLGERVARTSFC